MQISDVIADMLTRIRNAGSSKHETVDVPASSVKSTIADILLEEGYIKDVQRIENGNQGILRLTLKYTSNKKHVISGIKRISKPGLRVYSSNEKLPSVLGGLGIAIISTSQGIMTDKKAKKLGVGGEVMAFVW